MALVNHLDNVEASNARSNKEEGEGKAEKKLPTSAESEAESELATKVGEKIDEANINSGNEVKKVEKNEAILMEERLKELDKEEFFANLTFPDLEFD